jgi:hypothetical protein
VLWKFSAIVLESMRYERVIRRACSELLQAWQISTNDLTVILWLQQTNTVRAVAFALMWGLGALIKVESRFKFQVWMRGAG